MIIIVVVVILKVRYEKGATATLCCLRAAVADVCEKRGLLGPPSPAHAARCSLFIGWSDNHFNNLCCNKSQNVNAYSAAHVVIVVFQVKL